MMGAVLGLPCKPSSPQKKYTAEARDKLVEADQTVRGSVFDQGVSCTRCMMVETGEATGHYGQECPSCGRHPRIPYVNYQEWPQEKT